MSARERYRSKWLALVLLGLVASLLPLTGIIAGTSDTAQTGTNSAASRSEPASADIVLARGGYVGADGSFECGAFTENLTTGFFALTNLTQGDMASANVDAANHELCVKNVGAAPVDVRVFVVERVDDEVSCTGDEADHDQTCGSGVGELGDALVLHVGPDLSCGGNVGAEGQSFSTLETTGYLLGSLAPGQQLCGRLGVFYPNVSNTILQRAQSDQVTWRYVVEATATTA